MKTVKEVWADEVLTSLDKIRAAKAPAGFYEKTLARLNAAEFVSVNYVLRIAAAVALLVAFNAFACVSLANYNTNKASSNLSAFAREYSITAQSDNF